MCEWDILYFFFLFIYYIISGDLSIIFITKYTNMNI